ncbi:hypothetical protein [Streptomyces spiralis]
MSAGPGADELRIRDILVTRGVGPDAHPPVPPRPSHRPRDWLDEILEAPPPAPAPEPEASEPEPTPPAQPADPPTKRKRKGKKRPHQPAPSPGAPRTAWDTRPPDPRQSLAEAWDRIPYRLKWLASHAAAAAVGWRLGIVDWGTHTAAWYAAGHWTSPSAWVLYGLGACCTALHWRARRWAWLIAWAASIPLSSVVVGVLLYGTTP